MNVHLVTLELSLAFPALPTLTRDNQEMVSALHVQQTQQAFKDGPLALASPVILF